MTDFFEYADHNGLALFPCGAGTKRPILPWKRESSPDRKQWVRWAAEGHNLAIDCAKSGLIVVDVDCSKVTPAEASAAYHGLCQSWGLPSGPAVMTQSARGGWHVPFERPIDLAATDLRGGGTLVKISDVRALSDGELDGEVIGFKNRGYCIAPGSRFEGKPYLLMPDAPAPHECPAGLIDLIRLPVVEAPASGPTGISEPTDVARLIAFLDSHGEFDAEPDWFNALGAIKLACGDTEQGLLVGRQITREDATEEAFLSRWNRLASDARARPGVKLYTIGSMIKRAETLGRKFHVGKSASAMFQGVAELHSSPSIVPGATNGGMPMLARGDAQAALWAPSLAAVPRVERSAEHPMMPDTGHPLRAAINEAIPGIMASGEMDALAVIEAVHPDTAAKVGTITPTVRARAEALRQDAEHRLAPTDYTRDHKGAIERDNPDNVRFLLTSLNIDIRFNAWLDRVELQGWKWPTWTELSDSAVAVLMTRAAQTGTRFTPAVDFIWRTVQAIAVENAQDPARDMLDNLEKEWDGEARLHSWLSHACGVPYDAYHQAVGATILLGLVARIRRPGVKFDLMPVFVSEKQGTSKSTLARMLALNDAWFVENVALGESSKELVLLLAGKSVTEISEMRTRGEVDAIKAMISATHDEGRPAYGRATVKRPRRNIFIGTTNRLEFLDDQSGGRRFLPIAVQGEIDLEFVRTHLPQLVGEAATLQSRGAEPNIPREVWGIAGEHQAAATAQSSAEVLLTDWFAGEEPCWITPANLVLLLRQALGRDVSRGVYAPVMSKLGFKSKPHRDGEGVHRGWVRGMPPTNAPGYGAQLSVTGRPALQRLLEPPRPQPSLPPLPY
jgi:putative DNA primase/helicase